MTIAIPDATAANIIGQEGKGLKQLHDISGAWVSAYTLKLGPHNEHHISIYNTDKQISDALVVLGKRLMRKCVHGPTIKKMVPRPSADWVDPVPPHVVSKLQAGPLAPFSGQWPSSHIPALSPLGLLLKSGTPWQALQPLAPDPSHLPHSFKEFTCIHHPLYI